MRMPINIDQLKQRINEILESKNELNRLTLKPYSKMSIEEKHAVRYHIIVIAEALGSICLQIAMEDLKRAPQSY